MDPDAAHYRMVKLAKRIIAVLDKAPEADIRYDANELAEAVEALDGWLRKGGFLPKAWAR